VFVGVIETVYEGLGVIMRIGGISMLEAICNSSLQVYMHSLRYLWPPVSNNGIEVLPRWPLAGIPS
jgi:hypothetical protein